MLNYFYQVFGISLFQTLLFIFQGVPDIPKPVPRVQAPHVNRKEARFSTESQPDVQTNNNSMYSL